jgi:hypothetical protein
MNCGKELHTPDDRGLAGQVEIAKREYRQAFVAAEKKFSESLAPVRCQVDRYLATITAAQQSCDQGVQPAQSAVQAAGQALQVAIISGGDRAAAQNTFDQAMKALTAAREQAFKLNQSAREQAEQEFGPCRGLYFYAVGIKQAEVGLAERLYNLKVERQLRLKQIELGYRQLVEKAQFNFSQAVSQCEAERVKIATGQAEPTSQAS